MKRINKIAAPDKAAYTAAKAHWDSIAKPLGSFGLLEEAVQKISAVQQTASPDISRKTAVIMCGDHGVVSEGVTQCGSEVTAVCAKAIAGGTSNINALARCYGVEVAAVDMGIASDVSGAGLIDCRIARGTNNIAVGSAMTAEQCVRAVTAGMDVVKSLKESGTKLIIAGEMGIGNTTCTSAIASVLLGLPPEKVTGRGAGLTTEGLRRKVDAVKRAIEVNSPDRNDPLSVLQKLGGFEIAGMTGLFLGGAYYRIPVIIDGVTSSAAAAIACGIAPECRDYMLASHCSGEPAGAGLLNLVGLRPLINADLRLGEGTGGVLLAPLLDGALALYNSSHKFDETPIERYVELR